MEAIIEDRNVLAGIQDFREVLPETRNVQVNLTDDESQFWKIFGSDLHFIQEAGEEDLNGLRPLERNLRHWRQRPLANEPCA